MISSLFDTMLSNSADDMSERIQRTISSGLPWLVAEHNAEVLGYAYASKWKERNT